MKKIFPAIAVVILVLFFLPSFAVAERNEKVEGIETLIDARQTDIYVEGEVIGDLVLGARGAIQVIYVDERLSKAINADVSLESWVRAMGQFYGTDATRGKKVFIVHMDIYKPWDFDYTKLFVGEHHLQKEDILSSSMTNPFGELPSKSEGYFAFAVPNAAVKAGANIKIGYGDDSSIWKALK